MSVNLKRFNIDYVKLVLQRLPHELRVDEVIAFVNILAGPFVSLYNRLIAFKDSVVYKLTITPQVCFLEKMLNDRYDNVERRIYIEDGISTDPLFLYTRAEEQPIWLYTKAENQPIYLRTKGELGIFNFDFVVYVPSAIGAFNEPEMTALVEAYKLAGKKFKIQIAA